jgi:hypothetical protein
VDNHEKTITLLKDKDWSIIDGEPCRVIRFTPFASVKNGKIKDINLTMPYCSLTIECKKFPCLATGFITHKVNFMNLWKAFKERGLNDIEEVIIIWTAKHYKTGLLKLMLAAMPKIVVMICHKYAFEALTDPESRPDLSGLAWVHAILPIEKYKPDVIEEM